VTPERPAVERRILSALEATPPHIPVILGGCGSGRTSTLFRVGDLLGPGVCQYIDAERVATTPEGFLRAVTSTSPYRRGEQAQVFTNGLSAREAFITTLSFLRETRAPGDGPATFLLDEVLELRTFENFPGLRNVLRDLLLALGRSTNRFVLTTRYVTRAHRLLRDASAQFEVIHLSPLSPGEATTALSTHGFRTGTQLDELGRAVQTLTDGRPAYVRALAETMVAMDQRDPVSALAAQMAAGGQLFAMCRFCYELRLHRARGYGALKAILQILSAEEPLTLTEIAHRLSRTPGSTKDYLSWLEDVDLVTVRQKRYSFTDPLLRLWVRLHCRPVPPKESELAKEVQEYALAHLPYMEPALALAGHGGSGQGTQADSESEQDKTWGMIEID
jgi:hypothetical protein